MSLENQENQENQKKHLKKGWVKLQIEQIGLVSTKNINPSAHPQTLFELYSVPASETGEPEQTLGNSIGSTKQIVGALSGKRVDESAEKNAPQNEAV